MAAMDTKPKSLRRFKEGIFTRNKGFDFEYRDTKGEKAGYVEYLDPVTKEWGRIANPNVEYHDEEWEEKHAKRDAKAWRENEEMRRNVLDAEHKINLRRKTHTEPAARMFPALIKEGEKRREEVMRKKEEWDSRQRELALSLKEKALIKEAEDEKRREERRKEDWDARTFIRQRDMAWPLKEEGEIQAHQDLLDEVESQRREASNAAKKWKVNPPLEFRDLGK